MLQRRLGAVDHLYDNFLESRFAGGLVCLHCDSISVVRNGHAANVAQRYLCMDCGKSFTAATGTILAQDALGSVVQVGSTLCLDGTAIYGEFTVGERRSLEQFLGNKGAFPTFKV